MASRNAGFAVLSVAPGAAPTLLLRESAAGAVRELAGEAWASGPAPSAPLPALARAVLDREAWLLGGAR